MKKKNILKYRYFDRWYMAELTEAEADLWDRSKEDPDVLHALLDDIHKKISYPLDEEDTDES